MAQPTEIAPIEFSIDNFRNTLRNASSPNEAYMLFASNGSQIMPALVERLDDAQDGAAELGISVHGLFQQTKHLKGWELFPRGAIVERYLFEAEPSLDTKGRRITPDWAMEFVGTAIGADSPHEILLTQQRVRRFYAAAGQSALSAR